MREGGREGRKGTIHQQRLRGLLSWATQRAQWRLGVQRGGAGGGPGVLGAGRVWEANFKCHEGRSKWSEQGCGVHGLPS